MPPLTDTDYISFRPVDLIMDREVLLSYAKDLFTSSFDDPAWFERRFGKDGEDYIDWLTDATGGIGQFAILFLIEGEPAGLVALGPEPNVSHTGHVYHYYLSPQSRGRGFGDVLDDYATSTLARHGFLEARLNVAPGNAVAIRFYERRGWQITAATSGAKVLTMKKPLDLPTK